MNFLTRCLACSLLTLELFHGSSAMAQSLAFRVATVDKNSAPLQSVSLADEFVIQVFAQDLRTEPAGILSAYLDLDFSEALLAIEPESLRFGPQFGVLSTGELSGPGLLDEVGSFVAGIDNLPPVPTGIGGSEELFFSLTARAVGYGRADIATSPADNLPLHAITLFGRDDALPATEVSYGSNSLLIVPEPASAVILLLLLLLSLPTALRFRRR